MKKTLFDNIDRQMMIENKSLKSAFMKLYIQLKKMERKIINKIIDFT